MRYSHDSWSIELPQNWQVEEETEMVAFFHEDGVGNFEVSTFFADQEEITIDDILEFAEVDDADQVTFEYLSGIHKVEVEEDESVYQWWLSISNQMVYATYVCPVGSEDIESEEREAMIRSLRSSVSVLD